MNQPGKITHKFSIEAVWDEAQGKFTEYKTCEVEGAVENLSKLISDVAMGSPVVAAIVTGAFKHIAENALMKGLRLRQAKTEGEIATTEAVKTVQMEENKPVEKPIKPKVKNILDMSREELKEFVRRKNANK